MAEVDISKDVLLGIASMTLDQITGLEPINPPVKVGEVLSGKRSKGLKVEVSGKEAVFDLTVNVDFGANIVKVCQAAQKAVVENVELMTGMKVRAVNITVHGICVPKTA
ncbi:putative alkaline shock family protein YloU [Deinobacterium chartae]|uniref:Putative alkaline shock family protein YloU n=1 Tax=Deinobacterium chartae TaxID=521158 RepID=A0A841I3R5_9DEIO|nr:Asp23/Gls24 family envelope stress response protein [Deinobacterium chartae]MBB6098555.1 putative alkaline shock family protein YloU [Deinobacterium chartae]